MNYIVMGLSNYIMIAFMGLYMIESFWPLFLKKGDLSRGVYIRQCVYILMIHTLGMTTLYFRTEDSKYILLYLFQVLVLLVVNRLSCIIYSKISRMMLNHMCLFLSVGFIMLSRINYDKAVKQLIITGCSVILFLLLPALVKKCKFIKKLTMFYGIIGMSLLVLVLSLGKTVNGSKLNFQIGGLSFQSSEFVKILFVFLIAGMLYKKADFLRVFGSGVVAALFLGMLAVSKDLGGALIYFLIYIGIVFYATGNFLYVIGGFGAGTAAAIFAYNNFAHVRVRIATWLDPWVDIDRTGYQLSQSLFGIGTGNWFGMGIGRGRPESIPFVDADFIFSAICEELGCLFGIFLILTYLALFILFIRISMRTVDKYYRLVGIGMAVLFISEVVLTIGGGTRLIPLTGVTLPLVSKGGSSTLATFIVFGIVQGIAILKSKLDVSMDYDNEYYENDSYDYQEYDDYEEAVYKRQNCIINAQDGVKNVSLILLNAGIFISMIVNITMFLKNDRETVINNSYNLGRQEVIAEETIRGAIYASDGEVLAYTEVSDNGEEKRIYPYGSLYAHAVGYSTFGKSGIENNMNISLISSDIPINDKISLDMKGRKYPANNVYTTLDPVLQQEAYDALGAYRGAIVVQEAGTGRILAMVSKPDFDPNDIANDYESISEDLDRSPLLNRVTNGLYPPGSTFKILTALEYIKENDNYESYSFDCNGHFSDGDDRINCYHGMVHGHLDFVTSFAKSCNSSFANIGLNLDRTKFAKTLEECLFNKELPVAFDYKSSHITMGMDITNDDMMQAAIGQGKTVITPLHLNMITAAIANDGKMMAPYMVDEVRSADGKTVKQYKPSEVKSIMNKEEAETLKCMMIQVVENGTASKLKDRSYTAAGKTGSAEFGNVKGQSHAWFTGFAPAENPEIVVTVIIEGGGSGGDYSAPVARRLFDAYFDE